MSTTTDNDTWPTLDELLQEEAELELPVLTERDAFQLGSRTVESGLAQGMPIAVGLWRAGRQLFHAALPGSTRDNDTWLRRKGRVVMRFEHSSLYVARFCQDQGFTLAERFSLPADRYAASGGAVPIQVAGAGTIGWFGVSGLPQLEDHRLVVATLRAHLEQAAS